MCTVSCFLSDKMSTLLRYFSRKRKHSDGNLSTDSDINSGLGDQIEQMDNYRSSTLARHVALPSHKEAVQDLKMRSNMETSTKNAFQQKAESITRALQSTYWLAKENIASLKYESLLDFLDFQGVDVNTMSVGGNASYKSRGYKCSYRALVKYFKKHDKSKNVQEILEKLTDYRFVSVMHIMMDIIPHLSQPCLLLQKSDLDIAAVKPAIQNTLACIKKVESGDTVYQRELREKLKTTSVGEKVKLTYKEIEVNIHRSTVKKAKDDIDKIRKDFCIRVEASNNQKIPH